MTDHDLEPRLEACFAALFPKLAPSELRHTSMASNADWDSLASVTLVALVEEEFGRSVEIDDLEDFVSFDAVRDWLQRRTGDDAAAGT